MPTAASESLPDVGARLTPPGRLAAVLERPSLLWLGAGLVVALTVAGQLASLGTSDMGFLLYAAGRVLDGARMYRDVVEINPPLILWLNLPVVRLSRALQVSDFTVYRLAATLLVGGALLFVRRLAARYAVADQAVLRRYVLCLLCIALFPLAGQDFGEREHFVIALLLPYLMVVTARLRGRNVPPAEEAAVGVLAGVGVALKPYFGLAWLALEGLRRWRVPDDRRRLTPAAGATAVCLLAYVTVVVLIVPEYVILMGVLGPPYGRFLRDPFLHLLVLAPGAPLVLFTLLALAAVARRLPERPLVTSLAAAMVACFLAGAAQQKGLPYHFLPARVLAFVLLGLLAAVVPAPGRRLSERVYARLLGPLTATLAIIAGGDAVAAPWQTANLGGGARRDYLDYFAYVRAHAGGRPLAVLSWHLGSAFPLVNYANVPLASRFPHLWMFPAAYWDSLEAGGELRYHSLGQMSAAERWMYDAVRHDLLFARPRLLIVLRPARDAPQNGLRRLQYIRYFERQPELARFFSDFQFLARKGEFDLYERVDSGAVRTSPPPSGAPGTLDVRRGELGGVQLALADPQFAIGAGVFVALLGLAMVGERRRRAAFPGQTAA